MKDKKNKNLIKECQQIEEDSLYTAEVHYIIGDKMEQEASRLKLTPPAITILSASALLLGVPNWVTWITLFSALVTITNLLLEPDRKSKSHFEAAKNFTALRHETRSLYETFKDFLSTDQFYAEVKRLREKYNLFAQLTPPTNDKEAWEEARENIKKGIHKADFREEE